jgi:hypothetical protein
MKMAYVVVVDAPDENEARRHLETQLRPHGDESPVWIGGGTGVSSTRRGFSDYRTGPVAAAIAVEAFRDDEDECERLSLLLHAEAVK